MVQSSEFDLIKQTLSTISYTRCILFGSRARGTARSDSDYDLLVIVLNPITHAEKFRLASRLRRSLAQKRIDADIIIRSEEEVENGKELRGSIVRNAVREGITI